MNIFIYILSSDTMARLVTALLHTLWQGTLIAGLLYLFLRQTSARRAETRYILATLALAGIVLAGLITWAWLDLDQKTSISSVSSSRLQVTTSTAIQALPNTPLEPMNSLEPPRTPPWTSWAAGIWIGGVTVMFLRALAHLLGAGRLRRQAIMMEDQTILNLVNHHRRLMNITRQVRVCISEHITSPAVLGVLWPTILVPASMLSGIPADQLRAILTHELAHIRRYDYLVNLIQMFIEILFFFNPAVWWISRQIRIEREACCDQIAVTTTGQTVTYIQTLADWVRKLQPLPATLPAFADAVPPSKLLDRIKRLLAPSHRPAMRLSWHAMILTLLAAGVLLLCLRQGIFAAVKVLSPKERIAKIERIKQEYTEPESNLDDPGKQTLTVSGTVQTSDYKPLPADLQLHSITYRSRHSTGCTLDARNGTFTDTHFPVGQIYFQISGSNYATSITGPINGKPGSILKDIKLVLERGFPALIKTTDPAGKPIPRAHFSGGYKITPNRWSGSINRDTDENGSIRFQATGKFPIGYILTAPGFQKETGELRLTAGTPAILTLKPAKIVQGTVVSQKTGKPIPDATVRLLMERNPTEGSHYSPDQAPLLAKADSVGRFTINTLRDNATYVLLVEAPGYGPVYLERIEAGQKNLKAVLGPELYVRGKIIGPPGKPGEYRGPKQISYLKGITFTLNSTYGTSSSYSEDKTLNIQVRNGVGYFETKDVWLGQLQIQAGGKSFQFDIDGPTDNLVIDLTSGRKEFPQREVVLKFEVPKNSPSPTGKIKLEAYTVERHRGNQVFSKYLPIKNSQVRVKVPTPGFITYEPADMIDYWIKNQMHIEVSPGSDPFVITVPAIPGGAIYGKVVNPDDSPATNVLISAFVKEKSPLMENDDFKIRIKDSAGGSERDTKFMAAPLPLGGSYFIVAHRANSYVVSPVFEIDEANPIRRIELKLAKGVPVPVTILDPNGRPVPNILLQIHYNLPSSHGFGGAMVAANRQGQFVFEHINPNTPGSYSIGLPNRSLYQPVFEKFTPTGKPVIIHLKPGLIVTGVVVDDNTGYPVPGAEIFALADDQQYDPLHNLYPEDRTNKKGEFRFSNMPDRKYKLHCLNATLVDSRDGIPVRPGQPNLVILRVNIPEWSDLKPNTSAPKVTGK